MTPPLAAATATIPSRPRLEAAVAAMLTARRDRTKAAFALPESRFLKHKRRADELTARRHIKRLVAPANAAGLLGNIPAPGEITHAVLRGDFVLGDALPALLAAHGPCPHMLISTLALSRKNAETLRDLLAAHAIGRLTLICSHYFRAVDKTSTFHQVHTILASVCTLKISRCHAKIILLKNDRGDHLVLEGSANLRSSDTIEQLTIFNDPDLHQFHEDWMTTLPSLPLGKMPAPR